MLGVLYDVHGNLPALEAVLAEVPDDATLVVGGDVAAGPFPSQTLERLRAFGERVHWLRGNASRGTASKAPRSTRRSRRITGRLPAPRFEATTFAGSPST